MQPPSALLPKATYCFNPPEVIPENGILNLVEDLRIIAVFPRMVTGGCCCVFSAAAAAPCLGMHPGV
jgi:hypothetical protein